MAEDRRVRIGVVRYGYWGSKHVRVLGNMPGVEVMVVGGSSDRLYEAEQHYPAALLATLLKAALDDLDSVLIATRPTSHARLALHALQAGKHTLVGKPLATSVDDSELRSRAPGVAECSS